MRAVSPCPTPELEDHPLSAAFSYLFDTFTATPPPPMEAVSSIFNPTTRHDVAPCTSYSQRFEREHKR